MAINAKNSCIKAHILSLCWYNFMAESSQVGQIRPRDVRNISNSEAIPLLTCCIAIL